MLITHTNTIELDNNQPQQYFLNSGDHYSAEKKKKKKNYWLHNLDHQGWEALQYVSNHLQSLNLSTIATAEESTYMQSECFPHYANTSMINTSLSMYHIILRVVYI